MGCSKSSSKREVYSNTILPQETRNISNNNITLHLKQLEKEEKNKPKVSRRKEIIKIRSEINEKEMKEGFPGGAVVKNPPANTGDMGSSPGPGRSHMPQSN